MHNSVIAKKIPLESSVPKILIFKCPDKMSEQTQSTQTTVKNGQKLTIISGTTYAPSHAHMGQCSKTHTHAVPIHTWVANDE